MPEEIMVASWRDMTVSSCCLTRFGPSRMSILRPDFFSSRVMTLRPRPLSSSMTELLLAPSTVPDCGIPARSTALKAYVAIRRPSRSRP